MAYPFFMMLCAHGLNGQNAYASLLSLDFDETRAILTSKKEQSAYDIYLANLNDCLELILNGDHKQYDQLKKDYEARLGSIEAFTENKEKNFYASELRLQWAFVAVKFGDNWTAFWSLRKSLKLIDENIVRYPEYLYNQRTKGLLNVIIDLIPDNRQWMLELFGLKGDFQQGYQQLQETIDLNSNWSIESKLILALIDNYLLENTSDLKIEDEAPLYAYIKGLISTKQHQAEKAKAYFKSMSKNIIVKPYLLGDTYFVLGDYEKAIEQYKLFLNNRKTGPYRKDALLKVGLSYWFSGSNDKHAERYFKLAEEEEGDNNEIDKNAEKILANRANWHRKLLQLRFYLDGGAYEKASEVIEQLKASSLNQRQSIELSYRTARFFQLTDQLKAAENQYVMLIRQESEAMDYMIPYSFLQLGKIAQDQGHINQARSYYQSAMKYQDYPYEQSIQLKANLAIKGLNRLND